MVRNQSHNSKVTVRQLIESLQQYDLDAPVEIAVYQYNKIHPVVYASPVESYMVKGSFATMRNGQDVRIDISLPYDDESFMFTGIKKTK